MQFIYAIQKYTFSNIHIQKLLKMYYFIVQIGTRTA